MATVVLIYLTVAFSTESEALQDEKTVKPFPCRCNTEASLLHESILESTPLAIDDWKTIGGVVRQSACNDPVWQLPGNGFVLGLVSCRQRAKAVGGSATAVILPAAYRRVISLKIACPGGCHSAVKSLTGTGHIQVSVDGKSLWQATVTSKGRFGKLTLGDELLVTFISEANKQHTLELSASPGVIWPVCCVQAQQRQIGRLIQGVAYSPFRDCQSPNRKIYPGKTEILQDLSILRNMGNAIRTYSSVGIQGEIASLARKHGLRVSAGAWLGRDKDANEKEIKSLIHVAKNVDLESVIVGNEVLLRHDCSLSELIDYIKRVKAAVKVPVTTAEISHILLKYPQLMEVLDYYLVHIYGYWEKVPIKKAAQYVVDTYFEFKSQSRGKPVVIGETGWPSAGPALDLAVPSPENQSRFAQEFIALARDKGIEYYYFSAFDELWKSEGGVGPYWGIFNAERQNKYNFQSFLSDFEHLQEMNVKETVTPSTSAYPPGEEPPSDTQFFVFHDYESGKNHFSPNGWMGDQEALDFNDCIRLSPDWADRSIRIRYSPDAPEALKGWAGIYWQHPPDNWADNPEKGYDLSNYVALRFKARGTGACEKVKFIVGGVTDGPFPSSIKKPIVVTGYEPEGWVTLAPEWEEFCMDLREADLTNVIDGFGIVVDQKHNPNQIEFYLDDIVFDRNNCQPLRPCQEPPFTSNTHAIYSGSKLTNGYDMGVATSEHRSRWVSDRCGYMQADYPSGQSWGAVYITVGRGAMYGRRCGRDFSNFNTLMVDLKGATGNEIVHIGIKDKDDPDDGKEKKKRVKLHREWHTCQFPLSIFSTANLKNLYIPFELVFEPEVSLETVFFKNIRYTKQQAPKYSCTKSR